MIEPAHLELAFFMFARAKVFLIIFELNLITRVYYYACC
ncbi:hypothetical protein PMAG_b0004 [Pseudoalteromonas mariniglutinosa NCIMB 1770]|nr:hypothetical protein [Pseudoalteromonas mariniglutinosa NCIMB 1770]